MHPRSYLRSCTALWHAVIRCQHRGLALLPTAPTCLLPGCETAFACLHDCQGYTRRFEDANVMQARDEAFVANAAIRVGY